MAKTYADIITEARDLLQDSLVPYRYSAATLLAALNRGLREMGRIRPDAFWDRFELTTADILVPEVVNTDSDPDDAPEEVDLDEDSQVALTDEIDFNGEYLSALVYFVVASAELRDEEYTNDGRASMMMAQFKAQLVAV
mgnify:CR=1 FL=1